MHRFLAPFVAALLLLSCSAPVDEGTVDVSIATMPERDLIDELVGDWQDVRTEGGNVFHEQWSLEPDGHLTGLGIVLSGKDTVWIEHLRIMRTDSGTWYRATIPTQNQGEAVPFKLVHSKDSLVFSNPDHDFPQFISYVPTEDEGWAVRVSGLREGVLHAEHFLFSRRKVEVAPVAQ